MKFTILVLALVDGAMLIRIKETRALLLQNYRRGDILGDFPNMIENFDFFLFKVKIGKIHMNKKRYGIIFYIKIPYFGILGAIIDTFGIFVESPFKGKMRGR